MRKMQRFASEYDFAVIGAGVFGAWTAHCLRRLGRRVLLLDGYGPGNSRASSGGETRIIRCGYGTDEIYTRWSLASLNLWRQLEVESRQRLFLPTGMLWMARENDPHTIATARTLAQAGVAFEQLDRGELERRYPQISFGPISWALYEPESGALLARRAVQCVVGEAIAAGVEYRQAAITPPQSGESGLLEGLTEDGERIRAWEYIFACGPWLPKLFPEVLGEVIHATRQEVYFFGVPPGDTRFAMPAMPAWIDFKSEFYGVPDIENRGFKMALDRHGSAIDPDTDDRQITLATLQLVREHLVERFPALRSAPLLESRVCQYENTPNGDFLVDRHPNYENVWLLGGGSGHGFKHGPAMGEFVAGLVTGMKSPEPRFLLASKGIQRKRLIF